MFDKRETALSMMVVAAVIVASVFAISFVTQASAQNATGGGGGMNATGGGGMNATGGGGMNATGGGANATGGGAAMNATK